MVIDQELLDSLTAQAQASPRLRMNLDLRNGPEDGSQRMLNALEPGTELPIHRHRFSSETVVILRGRATQFFYDDEGRVTEEVTIEAGSDCVGMSVEKGRWHKLVCHESGTVILECKDGPYVPIGPEDILNI
jgi:cupin fold WbuC family metalloprotein